MRVARMPFTRKVRGKTQVVIDIPEALRPLFPGRKGPKTALARLPADGESVADVIADFQRQIKIAREVMREPPWHTIEDPYERAQACCKALQSTADRLNATNERVRQDFNAYRLGLVVPAPQMVVPDSSDAGTDYEDIINLWRDERIAEGKPPSKKALDAKRMPMRDMFAWLKTRGVTGTDMRSVTARHLQDYKEHLLSTKASNINGRLHEIKYLYQIAEDADRLPNGNPAAKLKVPKKPPHTPCIPLTDDEAKAVLLSARESDNPIVRWFHPLAYYTGAGPDEIVKAKRSEFRQVNGRWLWDFSDRPITQAKTSFRPRGIPLHDALGDFIEWMQPQKGRLFDVTPTQASAVLMRHIRSLGIKDIVGDDGKVTALKRFYSWRHGFISQMEDLTTPDRSRFLAGHAPRDVHAKNYLHHELAKLVKAIKGLKNPIAP